MPENTPKKDISVVMPALNEKKNIVAALTNTLNAFKDFNIDGEIVVINDGSKDETEELVNGLIKEKQNIRLIKHLTPQGIGASFWEGVDNATADIIVLLPGDNENDPWEILRYYNLLKHVDIVIPFVFNKEVRPVLRNALSFIYRFIINTTFLVNFNYTNGTILYRKSILKELPFRSKGFFFQADILIRLVKKGYLFAEVPYRLGLRKDGVSKALSFPSLLQVMKGYLILVRDFYFKNKSRNDIYSKDSLTLERRL